VPIYQVVSQLRSVVCVGSRQKFIRSNSKVNLLCKGTHRRTHAGRSLSYHHDVFFVCLSRTRPWPLYNLFLLLSCSPSQSWLSAPASALEHLLLFQRPWQSRHLLRIPCSSSSSLRVHLCALSLVIRPCGILLGRSFATGERCITTPKRPGGF